MKNIHIYQTFKGQPYILIERSAIGREIQSLKLAISMGLEKIRTLAEAMEKLDDDSDEYDSLQERKNDYEQMVSDFNDRIDDLNNIPAMEQLAHSW